MRMPRITIGRSMGLVALTAIGLAALRYPTALAASGVFSLAVATISSATVAAISKSGRGRAICASFAFCGGGYLVLSLAPWNESTGGPHLVTNALVEIAHQAISGQRDGVGMIMMDGGHETIMTSPSRYWVAPQGHPYKSNHSFPGLLWTVWIISHSLLSLIIAATGGLLAARLSKREEESGAGRLVDPERLTSIPAEHP
jgi:hypothetical protein